MKLPGLLTTAQASARLGVCASAIRRMVYAGKLREVHAGDLLREAETLVTEQGARVEIDCVAVGRDL